ncbi:MAG: response regulator, partial [Desulfuromonadales bacterium]|nr:response regulator [Desulfuromonadales bacterium]
IGEILTRLNYEVTTVADGHDAYHQAETTRFDMIITDLNMPVMDGIEFTQRVKQLPNNKFVPIVMLSNEENQSRISQARKVGISTFLSKPVDEAKLQTIMQIVLG